MNIYIIVSNINNNNCNNTRINQIVLVSLIVRVVSYEVMNYKPETSTIEKGIIPGREFIQYRENNWVVI